jgi:hypothetical protein
MAEVPISELQAAVEHLHGCAASFVEAVPVLETLQGATIWTGLGHVFRLTGHPSASRCYAWSYAIDGAEDRRRFAALVHEGPVCSP